MPKATPTPQSVLDAYSEAVAAADLEAFMGLYAADARIFDAWEVWQIHAGSTWKETVSSWFGWASKDGGQDRPRFEEVQTFQGQDHAFISAFVHYDHFNAQGELDRSMRNRLSLGLVRAGERWLIQNEHTSVPGSMHKFDEMAAAPPEA